MKPLGFVGVEYFTFLGEKVYFLNVKANFFHFFFGQFVRILYFYTQI